MPNTPKNRCFFEKPSFLVTCMKKTGFWKTNYKFVGPCCWWYSYHHWSCCPTTILRKFLRFKLQHFRFASQCQKFRSSLTVGSLDVRQLCSTGDWSRLRYSSSMQALRTPRVARKLPAAETGADCAVWRKRCRLQHLAVETAFPFAGNF